MNGLADTTDADLPVDGEDVARGTLYEVLATLFDEPEAWLYEAMVDGSFRVDLEHLTDRSGLDVDVPAFDPVDDHELLCARFNDLFAVGYPQPAVPLYESDHVEDPDWHDVNLDLARAYDYFGVEIDSDHRDHHDHLVIELEFAGYLSRLAATSGSDDAERARRDFLSRHLLPFLESVTTAVEDEVETGIYDDVTAFALAVAETDYATLDSTLSSEVSSP
ncbi:MAG: molecular chaperone TorD family protein [Halodesulfurarchaeum sp.]